ncbi:MAG: hypothetical protein FWD60_11010 [Candidatus Azobacteroides sp.]|nr:hypothetical protein [Candidatus Azobacteroides sp.]
MKKLISIVRKISLVGIIIVLVGIGMIYLFIEYGATVFQHKKITIGNSYVYLKYKARGLNYDELSISTSKNRFVNTSTDYFYKFSYCLFYRIQNDTVFVYSGEIANQPPKFKSKIIIIQKSLSNPEFTNLYVNFKTLGYERFP